MIQFLQLINHDTLTNLNHRLFYNTFVNNYQAQHFLRKIYEKFIFAQPENKLSSLFSDIITLKYSQKFEFPKTHQNIMLPFGLLAMSEGESLPTLAESERQLLQQQTIDKNPPGTILQDFQTLLDFLNPQGIEVSGVNNVLPMKQLRTINDLLSHPIDMGLKRPVQKSYPYIHGLYWLLRASGITTVKSKGKKPILAIDQAVLESWNRLNPTDRYFNLLEAWMIFGTEEMLGERGGLMFNNLDQCLHFLKNLPSEGQNFADSKNSDPLKYWPGLHNLALLHLFGIISVTSAKMKEGKGWQVGTVKPTPFGMALLQLLWITFCQNEFFTEAQERLNPILGQLQPAFQEFFPEWQQNLVIPGATEFRDELYIFKVSLGKIWRRIAIPGKLTLNYLAYAILDSVEFCCDHLYQFTYKNRFGRITNIHHPSLDEPPFVDQVSVGDLPLEPGANMIYIFDFGDWWEFNVQLEEIKPLDGNMEQPKVLKKSGKSPQQYPDWDEWEEEEDE